MSYNIAGQEPPALDLSTSSEKPKAKRKYTPRKPRLNPGTRPAPQSRATGDGHKWKRYPVASKVTLPPVEENSASETTVVENVPVVKKARKRKAEKNVSADTVPKEKKKKTARSLEDELDNLDVEGFLKEIQEIRTESKELTLQ